MRNFRLNAALIFAPAVAISLPHVAIAQEGTQQRSALEEIVITAERREVNLQDTPISASVLSADALIEKGVDNLQDIQQVAPSIAINSYNRSTFINIRGVGIAQSAPTSNPGVAYYVDGVLIPHEQFIGQSFFDLNSVEVLRGPQGTLTGQNSTGGALYVRSPEPDTDSFGGYFDQTMGSDGWMRSVTALNMPMGEKAALRIATLYENKDGYIDNLGPSAGRRPGSSEMYGVRANLLIQPTDSQSYNIRYAAFDLESGNIAVKDRDDTNPNPYEISYDGRGYLDQKGYRASLEGRWDLTDGMQLRALYSTQDGYTKDQTDGDRSSTDLPIPTGLPASGSNRAIYPARVSRAQTDFETDIFEINLLSTSDGPVKWVAGAFHMVDDVPVELYRDNYSATDFVTSNSNIEAKAENTSTSLFGQVDVNFTDALMLTAGLRYSEDEQVYTRYALPGPPPPGCFPCSTTQDSSATTGKIGLTYYTNEDSMIYGTISKGYKAGGVNLDPRQGFFEPENNEVVEIGYKTTFSDSRLRFNGNVFYSDYTDIQFASLLALFGPPLPVTQNAASAEIYGAEIELTGQYDAFGFNIGLGYLEGSFAEDVILNDTNGGGNSPVSSGDDLPFTPNITFNAGMQYDFFAGEAMISPRIQFAFIDDQIATPFPHPFTEVESRKIVDLKLIIKPNEDFMVETFITNALDEEYVVSQIQNSSSADGGAIYGAPRQFGVRAKYDF
ncbi:MAG: TonB-dependent receptor [Cellvibrionaceae bacterium]